MLFSLCSKNIHVQLTTSRVAVHALYSVYCAELTLRLGPTDSTITVLGLPVFTFQIQAIWTKYKGAHAHIENLRIFIQQLKNKDISPIM